MAGIHQIIADHNDKEVEQQTSLPGASAGGGTLAVKQAVVQVV